MKFKKLFILPLPIALFFAVVIQFGLYFGNFEIVQKVKPSKEASQSTKSLGELQMEIREVSEKLKRVLSTSQEVAEMEHRLTQQGVLQEIMLRTASKSQPIPSDKLIQVNNFYEKMKRGLPNITAIDVPKSSAVLVDIGCNVGAFSTMLLERFQNSVLHTFEAIPDYALYAETKFETLLGALPGNEVFVNYFGLSNRTERRDFWMDDKNLGWNTVHQTKTQSDMKKVKVELVPFDLYAFYSHGGDLLKGIDLVKIDTEGAEYLVIQGMHETLLHLEQIGKLPHLAIEIGWGPDNHPNWEAEKEQFEWLFAHGYQPMQYEFQGTTDVIFVPK